MALVKPKFFRPMSHNAIHDIVTAVHKGRLLEAIYSVI